MDDEQQRTELTGFVYLMDDGRDLKFGITRDIRTRLKKYITENPRLICHDSFQAESLSHAMAIERELIARTQPYRSYGNEWCEHREEVFHIWNTVVREHARLSFAEWQKRSSSRGDDQVDPPPLPVVPLEEQEEYRWVVCSEKGVSVAYPYESRGAAVETAEKLSACGVRPHWLELMKVADYEYRFFRQ